MSYGDIASNILDEDGYSPIIKEWIKSRGHILSYNLFFNMYYNRHTPLFLNLLISLR